MTEAGTQTDVSQAWSSDISSDLSDLPCLAPAEAALSTTMMSCIKALLAPVSVHVYSLQKEIDEMKSALTRLSSSLTSFVHDVPLAASEAANETISDDGHEGDVGFVPATASTRRRQLRFERNERNDRHLTRGQMQSERRVAETSQAELSRDAVASMYVDMELKQRRARNIVVRGMPYNNDDFSYDTNLLADEFDLRYIPTVSCMRIGKRDDGRDGRVQPLLVTLESRQDAAYLIANARILHQSCDTTVRQNVYISADLSPAEAKAAYDLRCRCRELNE